jgi:hypothetical protein
LKYFVVQLLKYCCSEEKQESSFLQLLREWSKFHSTHCPQGSKPATVDSLEHLLEVAQPSCSAAMLLFPSLLSDSARMDKTVSQIGYSSSHCDWASTSQTQMISFMTHKPTCSNCGKTPNHVQLTPRGRSHLHFYKN